MLLTPEEGVCRKVFAVSSIYELGREQLKAGRVPKELLPVLCYILSDSLVKIPTSLHTPDVVCKPHLSICLFKITTLQHTAGFFCPVPPSPTPPPPATQARSKSFPFGCNQLSCQQPLYTEHIDEQLFTRMETPVRPWGGVGGGVPLLKLQWH